MRPIPQPVPKPLPFATPEEVLSAARRNWRIPDSYQAQVTNRDNNGGITRFVFFMFVIAAIIGGVIYDLVMAVSQ